MNEIKLELADLFGAQLIGRLAEMTSREREYRLIAASPPEQVLAALDGSVESVEQVTAPAGLFAWTITVSGRPQLNTAVATFFNFDWANKTASCFVCDGCGYIHWFLPKR